MNFICNSSEIHSILKPILKCIINYPKELVSNGINCITASKECIIIVKRYSTHMEICEIYHNLQTDGISLKLHSNIQWSVMKSFEARSPFDIKFIVESILAVDAVSIYSPLGYNDRYLKEIKEES